ncbi:MoaD/ThiS family protein [uncultured Jatrophihabitans sp.]|uniref:MoaD/ThiS family protein n=1 Tax=uncultured Jatrophihabitans sp. TaxID=1610747 RepID=UPI0035C96792
MATVTVRYWAGAARAAGVSSQRCDAGTLRELRARLASRPATARLSQIASLLVDGAQSAEDDPLGDDAVVDVLPPFAGG